MDSISHETVRRTLKNEVKSWQREEWVIPPSQNGSFVANMENVLDVYKRPYDSLYPVVCMDESPKQLIGETRIPVPTRPGKPARGTTTSIGATARATFSWLVNRLQESVW